MSDQYSHQGQMPVVIMKEGSQQTKGRDAQKNNISACKLISEIVHTSLGPRGLDKMLVDSLGDVTITNDGATILKEIDVQHPAAKMLVEVSKTTDNEVGDGTTSAVVLAGALIKNAETLINQQVHPTVIVDGYRKAAQKAKEFVQEIADNISPEDKEALGRIARTSIQTKLVKRESHSLAEFVVNAIQSVAEKKGDKYVVDIDDVKVEKKSGGSVKDSMLVKGIVLDKEVVHSGMPKSLKGSKIALLNAALEVDKTEFDAKINIESPDQMKSFLNEESSMIKNMVDKVVASGANVLFCQKGIDDVAQHYLAKHGIIAVRRVKESDLSKLSRATGGNIVTNVEDLTPNDLGSADLVEERKVEEDRWVFVEGCSNPKSVTLLIRGGSQRVVDEVERSVHDALMVVKDVIENPKIVAGGGAPETYTATKLREWSRSLQGRDQLAVEKFADSLESIPLTLAENAGMDPIDTLGTLRSRQLQGEKWTGIDVVKGQVADMKSTEIFEPLSVKLQIISSATEATSMILRIDDVISIGKSSGGGGGAPPEGGGGMPPEMAGGMGGMGGMGMPPMG